MSKKNQCPHNLFVIRVPSQQARQYCYPLDGTSGSVSPAEALLSLNGRSPALNSSISTLEKAHFLINPCHGATNKSPITGHPVAQQSLLHLQAHSAWSINSWLVKLPAPPLGPYICKRARTFQQGRPVPPPPSTMDISNEEGFHLAMACMRCHINRSNCDMYIGCFLSVNQTSRPPLCI